jgi:hypothetical protein
MRKTREEESGPGRNALWATTVLGKARFPDGRLNQRAISFLAQQSERPGQGILQGSPRPAAAKGNYRLLENRRVKPEHFWEPIHEYTGRRLGHAGRIVSIQDTTTLMFPHLHETVGLGTADREVEEALWMHSCLAARPNGEVLGLVHNQVWARPLAEFHKARERKKLPIEDKESFKWIAGIRAVTALCGKYNSAAKLVHVFDSEGDIHEVFEEILSLGHDAVIRCGRDRSVEGPYGHVRATLAAGAVLDRYVVEVPREKGRPKRQARVEMRSASLVLHPKSAYPGRKPLAINALWVHEPEPPPGVEPLDWVLLTTLPVGTADQCREVVALYKLRWLIEDFHLILKSGCKVEETQLKTADRIEELAAILSAVAVRILQLRQRARTAPDSPCTEILSEDEWRVLWIYFHRRPVPSGLSPPTIREAARMIGQLGGYLGRKCDGMPGVRVLWKGWITLQIMIDGYKLAQG